MGSPLEFMRRYWNPAAVLDALDIKAWPPSLDPEDESYYESQHRPAPAPESTRRDAATLTPDSRPSAATATGFSLHQQPPNAAAPARPAPWLCPRDAALRIQSAYRGHRVRDRVRRLLDLDREVEAVETRIMASLDQILGDDGERVRVNEMIMDVLVKLDGVSGECRQYKRSLIKKAISLQETLDSLVGGGGGEAVERRADAGKQEKLRREEELHRGNKEEADGKRPDVDDDREQGNSSHDEEEEKEEVGERSRRRRGGCDGVKAALDRVMEENRRLHGLVRDLLDSNSQQSDVVQQLSERVEYLERKLQRLGRKRRRNSHGRAGEASSSSSSSTSISSSEGEGDSDRDEGDRRGGDDQKISGGRNGGCEKQER